MCVLKKSVHVLPQNKEMGITRNNENFDTMGVRIWAPEALFPRLERAANCVFVGCLGRLPYACGHVVVIVWINNGISTV